MEEEEEGITAKRSGGMIRQLETTNTPRTAVLNVPDIFLFGNLFSPTTPSMVRKQGRETVIRALSHYFRPSLYFKSTLDLKAQVHFFLKRFLSLTVCNGRNELVGMPPKRLASIVACIKFKFKAPLIRVVMDLLLLLVRGR